MYMYMYVHVNINIIQHNINKSYNLQVALSARIISWLHEKLSQDAMIAPSHPSTMTSVLPGIRAMMTA